MYNLRYRRWIAISVSMLAMLSSCPVLAKPLVRAKTIVNSQLKHKAVAIDQNVSPQPVEAILVNVRVKQSIQSKVKKGSVRQVGTSKSVAPTTKTSNHLNADRSSQGISAFTHPDRVNSQPNHAAAIDRWID
jgi:hypothetical protein